MKSRRGLAPAFALSYLVGFLLIAALVHFGGVWNVLANTRLLDLLVRGGFVALTDQDEGFVLGVPDPEFYVKSQDPIDWELLVVAAAMFALLWGARAVQFHYLAVHAGLKGPAARNARAYLYGHGLNRLFPFGLGDVAAASALEDAGGTRERAAQTVYLSRLFSAFEVILFAVIGLMLTTPTTWLGEIFWPVVILATAWLLVRPDKAIRGRGPRVRDQAGQAIRSLASNPRLMLTAAAFSVIAFLLAEEAAYLIAQAFTSENVILNVEASVILMGVVGGQAARLVMVTPGGVGQFEWGFAASLYAAGVGFPEAATVALLVSAVRYAAGALIFGAMLASGGAGTTLERAFSVFQRSQPEPAEGQA